MDNKFSTLMFCREELLKIQDAPVRFSPSHWYRRYIQPDNLGGGVRFLIAKFNHSFDVVEEYALKVDVSGRTELAYRISVLGNNGKVGFLFQINYVDFHEEQMPDLRTSFQGNRNLRSRFIL